MGRSDWQSKVVRLAFVALALFYLAPLFVTRFLPAFDLPHHLAIADALTKASAADSPYARLFTVGLEVAPFDAHFVALVALAAWMPLSTAAKVLVGAQVIALPLATARLLKACARSPIPALLAFPLAYAMPLHYGLIAFVVAVPLLVWVLAEAADETAFMTLPGRQALLLSVLLLALFFAHLEAWAIGVAAVVVAVALQPLPRNKRLLGVGAALPSVVAFLLYFARVSREPSFAREPSLAKVLWVNRARELAEHGALQDLFDRARGLPIHLLRGFNDGADVVLSYAFFAVVALLAFVGWGQRRFAFPRSLPRFTVVSWLFAVGVFAYFGLPHHALPHAFSVYPRFAVVLAVVMLLVVPGDLAKLSPRAAIGCTMLATGAAVLHAIVVISHYAAFGREIRDFGKVLDSVPAGHSAGGLVFDAESRVMNVGGIFTGFPAHHTTERRSPRSSSYLYFCTSPQLPCRVREPEREPPLPFFSYPHNFDAARALREIDLLLGSAAAPRQNGSSAPKHGGCS